MRTAAVRRVLGRVLLAAAKLVLNWRIRRMVYQSPIISAADVARVGADGGPDDMVLVAADGALTLDATADDIATYQQAGVWPQYVCRVSTITGMLGRGTAEEAARRLTVQLVRQLAAVALSQPPMSAAAVPVPPGNAPIHLGGSAVTIRPDITG